MDAIEDLLNFVSTVWTDLELERCGDKLSDRTLALQDEAATVLENYGIHPELHYLQFLQDGRSGTFVIFNEDYEIIAEFDDAAMCVKSFHEDVDATHWVSFIRTSEREFYAKE